MLMRDQSSKLAAISQETQARSLRMAILAQAAEISIVQLSVSTKREPVDVGSKTKKPKTICFGLLKT
tara:strand:+ start:483 stop:683 length:201 start_codon:yes stop_codon:yes gene_type:complete